MAIKHRIDELYTACPFYGSRKIAKALGPQFIVNRKAVQRHMREMGFTAGRFSLEEIAQTRVFVLGNRYRIEAFSAWLPYKAGKAAVLDILRYRRHVPPEIVRAFMAESLRLLKEAGLEEASLPPSTVDRAQIESFRPDWKSLYLVHPRGANISKITHALAVIQKR